MRLELQEQGGRQLIYEENELKCYKCGTPQTETWFFCEIGKKTYCKPCMLRGNKLLCGYRTDHQDWQIDTLKRIESANDTE